MSNLREGLTHSPKGGKFLAEPVGEVAEWSNALVC